MGSSWLDSSVFSEVGSGSLDGSWEDSSSDDSLALDSTDDGAGRLSSLEAGSEEASAEEGAGSTEETSALDVVWGPVEAEITDLGEAQEASIEMPIRSKRDERIFFIRTTIPQRLLFIKEELAKTPRLIVKGVCRS